MLKNDILDYTSQLKSASVQASIELKEQIQHKIWRTTQVIMDLEEEIRERTKEAVLKIDDSVREKPYHAVGIALVVGMLAGYVAGRKTK